MFEYLIMDDDGFFIFSMCAVFIVGVIAGATSALLWKLDKYL